MNSQGAREKPALVFAVKLSRPYFFNESEGCTRKIWSGEETSFQAARTRSWQPPHAYLSYLVTFLPGYKIDQFVKISSYRAQKCHIVVDMFLIVPGHQPMSSASLGTATLVGKHFMILSVRLVPGLTVLSTEAVKRSENEAS